MTNGIYVCESAPSLKIKVRGQRMQFENKKLVLTDQRDIDFLDEQLQNNTHVRALIRKIDMAAAEAIARAHMRAQPSAATKGSVTSEVEKAQLDALKDDDRVNLDDPEIKRAREDLIVNNKELAEVEEPDLEAVKAEQLAKIKAAEEAAAAAAASDGDEKPAGEEKNEQAGPKLNIFGNDK